MSFLAEIKRRKVFQVVAVYAVVAWLIIQMVDVVSDPLNLPEWLDTVVIVLLAVGFPLAVVLAWAFDITPEGVKRDTGVDASHAQQTAVSDVVVPRQKSIVVLQHLGVGRHGRSDVTNPQRIVQRELCRHRLPAAKLPIDEQGHCALFPHAGQMDRFIKDGGPVIHDELCLCIVIGNEHPLRSESVQSQFHGRGSQHAGRRHPAPP